MWSTQRHLMRLCFEREHHDRLVNVMGDEDHDHTKLSANVERRGGRQLDCTSGMTK